MGKLMAGAMGCEPIDAVILWVDGVDPRHTEKLNRYLQSIGGKRSGAADKARFHNAGEIDYCVTSLLKFAPWLRTIYIVTDSQRPLLMDKIEGSVFAQKVQVVDHSVIFSGYEDCLPSFNSMAISSLLWRIPGLAEQFLYLNDDFVVIRPVAPDDFFRDDKIVLRGRWKLLGSVIPGNRLAKKMRKFFNSKHKKNRVSFWGLQQRCAELLGCRWRYFRLPHVPHSWRRSSWEQIFAQFPEAMLKNINSRLRSGDQYVPEGVSAHYHLVHGLAATQSVCSNLQLKPSIQSMWRIKTKLRNAGCDDNIVFACVQSIETASLEKQQLIFAWLDQRVGRLEDLLT